MKRFRFVLLAFILTAPIAPYASAEEGMWLFTDFPGEQMKKTYGFEPTQAMLDAIRLGSVRLAGGCSASFVSPDGLVMTNHHCIRSCVEDLSSANQDYLESGFLARAEKDEKRCPGVEANQLVEITDVTEQIRKATSGKQGAAFARALKEGSAKLEGACATGADVRCDVVTLFHGGAYHLYKYRQFQDVRLVFAPEFPMAAFGGDPDNFNFPRYAFDAAFLRVYRDGRAAKTPDFLRWAKEGVKEGELVFVSGHPGGTERVQTVEQLAFQRDVALPYLTLMYAELRGILLEFQSASPARLRYTRAQVRSVENAMKALRGRHAYLADPMFFEKKSREDQALRQKIQTDPKLKVKYAGAWSGIAQAVTAQRQLFRDYRLLEAGDAFNSKLFAQARMLVRAAEEQTKPSTERLREYTDARKPGLEQTISKAVPIRPELEEKTLAFSLRRFRELLGADHHLVQRVLGRASPEALARKLVRGSRLGDAKARIALYQGGREGLMKSQDPMVLLARSVDAEARALRKAWEDEVEGALVQYGELLNQAHVAAYGTSGYPDATFTLRLSYGQMKGWEENGQKIPALTTVGGLYGRDSGVFPFAVAPTWRKAKSRVDHATPMNIATTNDIIGGNSGSPLLNRDGHVVGLIFDGNLPSLAGRYGYDPGVNRAVAVHGDAILIGLEKVYGATRVAKEIRDAAE